MSEASLAIISIFCSIWAVASIVIPVCCLFETGKFEVLPHELKKTTTMNWFGCTLVSLLLFIFTPIFWIGKLIYWLCHI